MKEYEALKIFDEHIDELHEYVTICGYHYTVSKAFKEIDPIAYEQEFLNWLDAAEIEVEYE